MKTYKMVYWVHMSDVFEIKANSEEEAEQELKKMIEKGDIDINDMEIGDDGIECNGVIED